MLDFKSIIAAPLAITFSTCMYIDYSTALCCKTSIEFETYYKLVEEHLEGKDK